MLEDVSLALTNHSNNIELVLLKEVLELAAYALGYDGRQFYSQVHPVITFKKVIEYLGNGKNIFVSITTIILSVCFSKPLRYLH